MMDKLFTSTMIALMCIINAESFEHCYRRTKNTAAVKTKNRLYRFTHVMPTVHVQSKMMNEVNIFTYMDRTASSPIILSSFSSWGDDFSYRQGVDLDDVDLSYLPIDVFSLPPRTENLLRRATLIYVMSEVKNNIDRLTIDEVLETIEEEYQYRTVPLSVGELHFEEEIANVEELDTRHPAAKVLSFAAMHCLPAEITVLLFKESSRATGKIDHESSKKLQILISTFQQSGWKAVSFPNGLSLRLKRGFMISKRVRFNPIPRKSFLTRKRDINDASRVLELSSVTTPPKKIANVTNMMAVFDEIVPDLTTKSRASLSINSKELEGMLAFFPRKNRLWIKFVISSTKKKAKSFLGRRNDNFLVTLGIIFTGAWFVRALFYFGTIVF